MINVVLEGFEIVDGLAVVVNRLVLVPGTGFFVGATELVELVTDDDE